VTIALESKRYQVVMIRITTRSIHRTLPRALLRTLSTALPEVVVPRRGLRLAHSGPTEKPFTRAKISAEDSQRVRQGTLADFNIYSELAPPVNNIDVVLEDGFQLATGAEIRSSPASPQGLILLGNEAFQIDLSKGIEGLDTGLVEIDSSVISVFAAVHPKPEILVIGLGGQSRVLGPKTSNYIRSLGMRIQLSNTVSSIYYCYEGHY
jgi:NADH dehydrogenase [ubiquinone] 1 alpha subcomplex assembly factor 3